MRLGVERSVYGLGEELLMKRITRMEREVRRLSIAVQKKHELNKDLLDEVAHLREALRQLAQAESAFVREHVRNAIEQSDKRLLKEVYCENKADETSN